MNPESGRIYYGDEEIEAAKGRGEPLIEMSPKIADSLAALEQKATGSSFAPRNRAERRAQKFGGARGRTYERR